MNIYSKLLVEAEKNKMTISEKRFKSKAKGLIYGNKIGISKALSTEAERACILAEELGHYHTTHGNIINQAILGNKKQERKARMWAHEKLIPLTSILEAN